MWAYNLVVNNIVRSKYIFVENNKIEILFSNYIFSVIFHLPGNKLKNLLSSFINFNCSFIGFNILSGFL